MYFRPLTHDTEKNRGFGAHPHQAAGVGDATTLEKQRFVYGSPKEKQNDNQIINRIMTAP